MMHKFIFTCGDVNGIGPEVALKTLEKVAGKSKDQFIFICPGNLFFDLYKSLKLTFKFRTIYHKNDIDFSDYGILIYCLHDVRINVGKPTATSGKVSYRALMVAKEILSLNSDYALVTAPIAKEALKKAGVDFPGHTEMLASWFNEKKFCMMFLSETFKCGLVTIHEPIRKVPQLLTKKKLASIITTICNSLENDFKIEKPRIALLGLNPHAGENGNIGDEELKIISPVINELKNILVEGPFVPDAFFANKVYSDYDCVIGMYHDQLLIPFKLLNFEKGVNYTAGLPIIRTSPDHGTAFDIAGKKKANPTSMTEAYKWARKILIKRKKQS